MYNATATQLASAMMKGLGNMAEYKDQKALLKAKFDHNIYAFSAAKSISQYQLMSAALTDENGKLRTFNMFREAVEKINPLFNEQYLKAEYSNAQAQAGAAADWLKFDAEKDRYPYLIYRTMEDSKVRASHKALNGVKRPVDDPFWDKHRPPLDWGCRCWLEQSDEPRYNTPFDEALAKGKAANIKPYFKNNKANQGVVFNEEMTYFRNIGNSQKLDAVKNYGMKTYEQIKREANMYAPETPPAQTKEEFLEWWKQEVQNQGFENEDLIFKDPIGNNILLTGNPSLKKNKGTLVHIIGNSHEDFGFLIKDSIQNPNEVWSRIENNKLEHYYLKYYKEDIIVTIVREEENKLRAITSYRLNNKNRKSQDIKQQFNNFRQGILLKATKKF